MSACSSLNDSPCCHDAVDNGAAAEDDSWDDTGDSGRGEESSICPSTTGNTSNEVWCGSKSTTVVGIPISLFLSDTTILLSLLPSLEITSLVSFSTSLWLDVDEDADITDLHVMFVLLQESLLLTDWAGEEDEANSGRGLIWPSWKTLSMAWQTNLYCAGVWIMLARWSLMMRVNSSGYTGWLASIKYNADSIKIRTPVRPMPENKNKSGQNRYNGIYKKKKRILWSKGDWNTLPAEQCTTVGQREYPCRHVLTFSTKSTNSSLLSGTPWSGHERYAIWVICRISFVSISWTTKSLQK